MHTLVFLVFKVRLGKVWGYYFSFTTVTDLVLGSKCGSEFEIAPQYFAILVVRNKFCWFSISPCPVCEEGRSENVSAKVEKITLNYKFNFQLGTVSGQVKHSFSIAYFQFHLKHFAKEWFNVTFHLTGDQLLTVRPFIPTEWKWLWRDIFTHNRFRFKI